ncbi:MAG TPA: tetratricopeptide repeat protein [Nocardioidaceae bacterium]|nr:tetratricopeptide repeat protein [Nocardioidaceae bacterium]
MAESTVDAMEAAKTAIQDKDWTTARRLLAPLVAENPHGIGAFHLARAELELGRPDMAAPLIVAFRSWRPKHVGARMLAARIHLANGQLDEAEAEARTATELDPESPAVPRLLGKIAAAREVAEAERFVSVIDSQYQAARTTGTTPEMLEAAQALQGRKPGSDWTRDRRQATIAYFHFATDLESALRNYDPHLIDISSRFDYISWPKRIQEYVRGKSVLDVGCGFGGFGMGFLIAGTKAYVGLDPAMELDSSRAKNKRVRKWADMGVTPREIADAIPAIRLFQSSSEDKAFDETFDTIALHNVTEHLLQLEEVLNGLSRFCKPDTNVVFHHHNYYCWNGHHLAPNQPNQLDEQNSRHQQVYDWRHINLVADLPEDHYIMTNLNRIRLDELYEVTAKHFHIVRWDEVPSTDQTLARLTPEIVERVREAVPDISERELITNAVLAVARPKI